MSYIMRKHHQNNEVRYLINNRSEGQSGDYYNKLLRRLSFGAAVMSILLTSGCSDDTAGARSVGLEFQPPITEPAQPEASQTESAEAETSTEVEISPVTNSLEPSPSPTETVYETETATTTSPEETVDYDFRDIKTEGSEILDTQSSRINKMVYNTLKSFLRPMDQTIYNTRGVRWRHDEEGLQNEPQVIEAPNVCYGTDMGGGCNEIPPRAKKPEGGATFYISPLHPNQGGDPQNGSIEVDIRYGVNQDYETMAEVSRLVIVIDNLDSTMVNGIETKQLNFGQLLELAADRESSRVSNVSLYDKDGSKMFALLEDGTLMVAENEEEFMVNQIDSSSPDYEQATKEYVDDLEKEVNTIIRIFEEWRDD